MRHFLLSALLTIVPTLALAGQQAPPQWVEIPSPEGSFRDGAGAYVTDVLDITVAGGQGLEIDLGMKRGAAIVFSWRTLQPTGARVFTEFHGHTNREAGAPGVLVFYKKSETAGEAGALVAPFDGTHAWYFRNTGAVPVRLRLELAGFYQLLSKGSHIVHVR